MLMVEGGLSFVARCQRVSHLFGGVSWWQQRPESLAMLLLRQAKENAALLAAFATYGAGYVIRPLGAVFFGRIGDSTGRKYTFLLTIVFMGFSTFCVGLLPTFKEVGWLAPALLVLLRLVQGLAMGGEYGGAAIYVAEYSDPGRRGVS